MESLIAGLVARPGLDILLTGKFPSRPLGDKSKQSKTPVSSTNAVESTVFQAG